MKIPGARFLPPLLLEMNTWRVSLYGGLSPAGGVPAEAHEEAEHH